MNEPKATSVAVNHSKQPTVECAFGPCTNRLQDGGGGDRQWCSKEHRRLTLEPGAAPVTSEVERLRAFVAKVADYSNDTWLAQEARALADGSTGGES